MPTPTTTTLDVLLKDAESKLISDGVFADNTCFLGLNPDQNVHQPSDQYAIITPGPQKVNQPLVVGGGRVILYFEGSFLVTLWSRLALDNVPTSDSYLTDASNGALIKMASIIESLHLYQPVDGSGNQLVSVPYKLDGIDSYSRTFEGVGWGAIKLKFLVEWQMTFN